MDFDVHIVSRNFVGRSTPVKYILHFTFTFIILTIAPSQEKTYPKRCTLDKTY